MNKIERTFRHLARLSAHLGRRDEVWESVPFHLEFSPNNLCNLRCLMCEHSQGIPPVRMAEEEADRVLDTLLPDAGQITPSALSEPLLAGIERIEAKCREHDCWLNIITNGTLLTPEMLERIAPRLFQLKFSCETHDRETFTRLRQNADYDRTLANLRYAARRTAELNIPFTVVTILLRPVLDQLVDYVGFLHDLGAKRLDVLHFLDNSPHAGDLRVVGVEPEARLLALRERLIEETGRRGMDLRLDMPAPLGGFYIRSPRPVRGTLAEIADQFHNTLKTEYPFFCHHSAAYLKVEPDGRAFPCCRAPRELELGNVLDQELEAVWNGPRARELRRSFFTGELLPACRRCSSRPDSGAPRV